MELNNMELNNIKNYEFSKNWRWISGFLHLIYEKKPLDTDDIKFNEETTNKVLDLLNKTNSDKDKYIKKFILITLKLLEESRIEKEKTLEKYNELKNKLLSFLKPKTSIVKKLIKFYNNKKNYDEMVGWTNGVNGVNQLKNYHQGNYRCHFIGKDKLREIPKIYIIY